MILHSAAIFYRQVPVTFGEFNVSDVRPAQLFDVLADLEGQLKWDKAMTEASRAPNLIDTPSVGQRPVVISVVRYISSIYNIHIHICIYARQWMSLTTDPRT